VRITTLIQVYPGCLFPLTPALSLKGEKVFCANLHLKGEGTDRAKL